MRLLKFNFFFLPVLLVFQGTLAGQTPEILKLRNKSFHAPSKYFVIPPAWSPQVLFLGMKKVKELRLSRFYRREEPSQKGNNHVALATYANGTRENIGQKLRYPIISGHHYTMNVWLAWSPVRTTVHPIQQMFYPENDLRPVKLQVYGFHSDVDLTNRLLAETPLIDHREWKNYTLEWLSPGKFQYIYLVASWYGDEYYNGNLLIDNISDIEVSLVKKRK